MGLVVSERQEDRERCEHQVQMFRNRNHVEQRKKRYRMRPPVHFPSHGSDWKHSPAQQIRHHERRDQKRNNPGSGGQLSRAVWAAIQIAETTSRSWPPELPPPKQQQTRCTSFAASVAFDKPAQAQQHVLRADPGKGKKSPQHKGMEYARQRAARAPRDTAR